MVIHDGGYDGVDRWMLLFGGQQTVAGGEIEERELRVAKRSADSCYDLTMVERGKVDPGG